MKVFAAKEVEAIGMLTAIELMREAFRLLSAGKVRVPLRTSIETDDKSGMALFMPSYVPEWKLFGLKVVSVFGENKPPMPVIHGQMLVMDATNGRVVAMLDAPAVTALRTGAASGLATDLLAKKDAGILAIFGTGKQAWTQIAGVCAVRKIKKVLIKGRSAANEAAFSRRVHETFNVATTSLGEQANLKEADIICTATTSLEPLFKLSDLKPGIHINAIGSYKPTMRELGEDVIAISRLVVDQRRASLHEAGELVIPIKTGQLTEEAIHGELGEIVAGKPGRTYPEEITVFKSVGNAIQDLAIARHLLA
jgi:ornithine cyclodeaminase/alanine dehydrogenase-like protein (mu-crystallin family)